jgi:trehalose 6-phosphate synthase/phosphatase
MTKSIDLNRITEAYYRSKARLILLDYDGTLVPFEMHQDTTIPDSNVRNLLCLLAGDPKNSVVLISGRGKEYLDTQWSNLLITLVAEHGGFYRNQNEDWREMFSCSVDWIPKTLAALNALTLQFKGSYIEEKVYSIAWHYEGIKDGVMESAKRQVLAAIRSLPVRDRFQIYDNEFTIELRTIGIDKGSFTSHWASNKFHDFVMAIGNGQTDEDLFKILGEKAYSIRVGRSNTSEAIYHLNDQMEVLPFLQSILAFERVVKLS